MTPLRIALMALLVGTGLSACGPHIVTDIALSPNHAKVTYVKQSFFAPKTGVVECQRAEDGSLSNCKKMNITWRKPN